MQSISLQLYEFSAQSIVRDVQVEISLRILPEKGENEMDCFVKVCKMCFLIPHPAGGCH